VITAIVDKVSKTATGEHLVVSLKDETANSIPLQIFISNSVARQISILPGDRITAYGTLTTYRNQREIVISSARDLSLAHNTGF